MIMLKVDLPEESKMYERGRGIPHGSIEKRRNVGISMNL
jgi:hypothetical protein